MNRRSGMCSGLYLLGGPKRSDRDRSRVHNRRRRPAVRGEAIENRLEVLDCSKVYLHEVAVFARDSATLRDLRNSRGYAWDLSAVTPVRTHAHDCANAVAKSKRVYFSSIR